MMVVDHTYMQRSSAASSRKCRSTVEVLLATLARNGDATAIRLLDERRVAEQMPVELVNPPPYRELKNGRDDVRLVGPAD